MKVEVVSITYAGIPLMVEPDTFYDVLRGMRANYYDSPWGLSIPGHAAILLTGNQVDSIETALVGGMADLEMVVNETALIANKLVTTEKTVTIIDMTPVVCAPLEGYTCRVDQIDHDNDLVRDKPTNIPDGLWLMELQDSRNMLRRLEATTTFDDSDTIEDMVMALAALTSLNVSIAKEDGNTPPEFAYTTKGLALHGVPASMALDVILANIGFVAYFDPFTSDITIYRSSVVSNQNDLIRDNLGRRIFGGMARVYGTGNFPQYIAVNDEAPTSYHESLEQDIKTTLTGTTSQIGEEYAKSHVIDGTKRVLSRVLIPDSGSASGADGALVNNDLCRSLLGQYRMGFAGFVKDFFTTPGYSMASFAWGNRAPYTLITRGRSTPQGLIRHVYEQGLRLGAPVVTGLYDGDELNLTMTQTGWLGGGGGAGSANFFLARLTEAGAEGYEYEFVEVDEETGDDKEDGESGTLIAVREWKFSGACNSLLKWRDSATPEDCIVIAWKTSDGNYFTDTYPGVMQTGPHVHIKKFNSDGCVCEHDVDEAILPPLILEDMALTLCSEE